MKKILQIIVLLFIALTLIGCTKGDPLVVDGGELLAVDDATLNGITFFTINDFHGAIFEDGEEIGAARLSAFLRSYKNAYPDNVVILSAGDMFQGTAVASMTRGKIVVEAMNIMGFDAMAIGNHEFDWGVPELTKFFDGNLENGEADFPFLGANIYDKVQMEKVEWATPYAIIERNGVKIGVIGTLGEDQTSSILASISDPFIFYDQFETIRSNASMLRNEHQVDVVVAVSHSDTTSINQGLANLTGDERIDLVVNGHTHRYYAGEVTRAQGGVPMPYVQSGNNGTHIGKITLEMNFQTKTIVDVSASNIVANSEQTKWKDKDIIDLFDQYTDEIAIANETLGKAGQSVNRTVGTQWAANVIYRYTEDADIGVVNTGGIRAAAFPMEQGEIIYYSNIFKMMPFENMVNKAVLTGAEVLQLFNASDLVFNQEVSRSNRTISGVPIVETQLYTVATVDYVFEQSRFPFRNSSNITYTQELFRDQLVQAVKDSVADNGEWKTSFRP